MPLWRRLTNFTLASELSTGSYSTTSSMTSLGASRAGLDTDDFRLHAKHREKKSGGGGGAGGKKQVYSTLEASQGQILSQSPTDAT